LDGGKLKLVSLKPVQDLPGPGDGFARLVALLRSGKYVAASIDAPFSIPPAHIPEAGHEALLDLIAALPDANDRPFPKGEDLVVLAERACPKATAKPLRKCESYWAKRQVNTRSTLWNGPRGGAPFAVACLALIARCQRPCWPWHRTAQGLLVEAFPAAQLRQWNLPARHKGDHGIDYYCLRDGVAYQCYAVQEPREVVDRAEKQKAKITSDLGKLRTNAAEIQTGRETLAV
jgi:hypothetical protein